MHRPGPGSRTRSRPLDHKSDALTTTSPSHSVYHTPTRSLRFVDTNLLSVPRVRTTFASRGFSVAAPTVWNSLPSGIRDSTHTFHRLLKTHCFQQAFGSPSGSPKCLRFGLWLTLCTLNMYLLTYLLTYGLVPDRLDRSDSFPNASKSVACRSPIRWIRHDS